MGDEKYYTATKRLDIRSGPGEEYDPWEKLEKGDEIIVPITGDWVPVLLEDENGSNITGWVLGKYLQEEPAGQKPKPPKPGEAPAGLFPFFEKNLTRMFGSPSPRSPFPQKNITTIDIGEFASFLDHVQTFNNEPFTSIDGHWLLEKPLKKALRLVCDRGLAKELKTYSGCWNIRAKSTNGDLSVHSWGLALDFNAVTCPLQKPSSPTWPNMVRDLSDDFVRCFAEAGFEWGGLWKSVHDPMHFQLAWTYDWRKSSAPLGPQVPEEAPVAEAPKPAAAPTPPAPFDFSTREGTIVAIKAECQRQGIGLPTQIAYVLATTEWETNHTFQPVKEAYWLSEDWRRNNLRRYYPYYGRGYVQLTWEDNYRKYGEILNIDLVGNPDLALDPQNALFTLVHGFKNGTFTGKRITNYINKDETDFINARRCINGLNKAEEIAAIADHFLEA